MDPISKELYRQQVSQAKAQQRAALVAKAAEFFSGVGPVELYRAEFDRVVTGFGGTPDSSKLLRIHADGSFRIVCGASGRILAEGPFSELTAQAATSGTSNT